jgi:hypothetical protein
MKAKNLFIIDKATIEAVSDETVAATVADLRQLDLYRLPYERVAVRIPLDCCAVAEPNPTAILERLDRYKGGTIDFVRDRTTGKWHSNLGPTHCMEFRNLNLRGEPIETWFINETGDDKWHPYELRDRDNEQPNKRGHEEIINFLITLLATKNALKRTIRHPLANRIHCKKSGSQRNYEYVTTISIPQELEADPEHPPTGGTKCPHLRRGHIRRQHYGPKNAFIRKIWIEPIFVNADPTFVSTRKAYNLGV